MMKLFFLVVAAAALLLIEFILGNVGMSFHLPIYLVGDGYAAAKRALAARGIETADTPPLLREENAASVARVGYRTFLAGRCVSDRELFPTYLRMPQAERERLERLKEENERKLSGGSEPQK